MIYKSYKHKKNRMYLTPCDAVWKSRHILFIIKKSLLSFNITFIKYFTLLYPVCFLLYNKGFT